MIKHIVCWKIKEQAEGRNRDENLAIFKEKLLALKGLVPGIRHLEVGINAKEAPEDNWDIILITAFDTFKDLDAYQGHPEHLKVVEFVKQVRELRSCVDFEC